MDANFTDLDYHFFQLSVQWRKLAGAMPFICSTLFPSRPYLLNVLGFRTFVMCFLAAESAIGVPKVLSRDSDVCTPSMASTCGEVRLRLMGMLEGVECAGVVCGVVVRQGHFLHA